MTSSTLLTVRSAVLNGTRSGVEMRPSRTCVIFIRPSSLFQRQVGQFDHSLLKQATLTQCQTCHQTPTDALHKQVTGNCQQCHSQQKWTPATFDHAKYFVLDKDHNATCVTCHERNDYSRYTCYGCHEHSEQKIRREHIEEGIRDFNNCVECHRNADEHDIRGDFGKGRGEGKGRKERKRDKDDY